MASALAARRCPVARRPDRQRGRHAIEMHDGDAQTRRRFHPDRANLAELVNEYSNLTARLIAKRRFRSGTAQNGAAA